MQHSPLSIGTLCVIALANRRKTQKVTDSSPLNILALGGIKTTPAISTTSTSLQPGEWGVDVVETADAEQFLKPEFVSFQHLSHSVISDIIVTENVGYVFNLLPSLSSTIHPDG